MYCVNCVEEIWSLHIHLGCQNGMHHTTSYDSGAICSSRILIGSQPRKLQPTSPAVRDQNVTYTFGPKRSRCHWPQMTHLRVQRKQPHNARAENSIRDLIKHTPPGHTAIVSHATEWRCPHPTEREGTAINQPNRVSVHTHSNTDS